MLFTVLLVAYQTLHNSVTNPSDMRIAVIYCLETKFYSCLQFPAVLIILHENIVCSGNGKIKNILPLLKQFITGFCLSLVSVSLYCKIYTPKYLSYRFDAFII